MNTIYPKTTRLKRSGLAIAAAVVMLAASLVMLQLQARAGFIAAGARGCGLFAEAVRLAQNGDTLTPMLPERTSDGVVISKNLYILGGWFPPDVGCSTENEPFTTTTDMLNAGFTFHAPLSRSVLVYSGGPVITIDPQVVTLTVRHMEFKQLGHTVNMTAAEGGGITGVISDGADVLLDNVMIANSRVVSGGGGLRLEVRGGSRLVISGSHFLSNTAAHGGGLEIFVTDNSRVLITGTRIASNAAAGAGGGARLVVESGVGTVANSLFFGNQAEAGRALCIEGATIGSAGLARVWLEGNLFDGQSTYTDAQVATTCGASNAMQRVFLPLVLSSWPKLSAEITGITLNGSTYEVAFTPSNFTPMLGDGNHHLHFFFDTVPPEQAGLPGSGPWWIHPTSAGVTGISPFTDLSTGDKPGGATQLCVLVANSDHSVQANSGNCFSLP